MFIFTCNFILVWETIQDSDAFVYNRDVETAFKIVVLQHSLFFIGRINRQQSKRCNEYLEKHNFNVRCADITQTNNPILSHWVVLRLSSVLPYLRQPYSQRKYLKTCFLKNYIQPKMKGKLQLSYFGNRLLDWSGLQETAHRLVIFRVVPWLP